MEKQEIDFVWNRFFDEPVRDYQTIETGINESDFRENVIGTTPSGARYVIKLTDNDFTFPEKIEVWRRTAAEYRKIGYYAPTILKDKENKFPCVSYKGRKCVAYAEEFAPYMVAEDRLREKLEKEGANEDYKAEKIPYEVYWQEMWRMTAKIAEKHFDYTEYPSAMCLFQTFCPSDETDEVTENAVYWKECADQLPDEFHEQVERIWNRWNENIKELEKRYAELPTSIFQGDLNSTNILIDDNGKFAGVFDFNLCGKEVCLNYLFREVLHSDFEKEVKMLLETIQIVREHYHFSQSEKELALSLYRCLKPLWSNKIQRLRELGENRAAIAAFLDETERYMTADIDFRGQM